MSEGTLGLWNGMMAAAPVAPAERLIGDGGLVVLSPHPDDETLGASALLLAAGRLGRRIGLVALTDGEGSHRASRQMPPPSLAALRVEEQRAAMAALGCAGAEELRLSLPDGASGRSPGFEEAAARIAALCDRIGATALAAPHPDDPHPDHHAAAELARRVRALRPALRLLHYEVWSRRLPPDAPFRSEGLVAFKVATDIARKRGAIACHRSQLGLVVSDDPEGFVLPGWFLAAQEDPLERYGWEAMPGHVPGPEHFARLYAGDGDPWHVRSSAYEADKRAASLAMLEGRRYASALEAGCGEGFLSRGLVEAGIAGAILGVDREPAIVERARARTTSPDVRFAVGAMPDALPEGAFDLVLLSEVLYFLNEAGLAALAGALSARMVPGAHLLLVSYLGPTDTPLGGREAADVFAACLGAGAKTVRVSSTPDYRIELLEWRPAPPAAPAEGGGDRRGEAASA
ncbi:MULTISPECIES: PIG-L family deacetylase [unclassified Aureimonas]|uniref:PIG-L family deacetylase n=1 Tax=unclassified Aureimonas TaxID=2615206 RepID=UPI0007005FAC|nr:MULTISPECIES: PIG-L family deacetylase [unclassified Aureimonas]KQT68934.1 hypothetical protein ASG54_04530 [Aureimonas sp. Leaf460]KQT69161.1 hypothetical protein ASG62_17135 [Aureimonas sp. Leaf427]